MATITKIEPQKNKQDRVNIFLDGEFFCAMQHFVCVKYGLKENLTVTKEHLQELTFESDKEQALNKVARLLQNGVKTEKQIATYLKTKGYDPFITAYVLAKLKEYHYVDDQAYAKQYVASTKRKYGKRKMQFELKQKGVSEQEIANVLNEFKSDQEVLQKLAEKYLKNKPITYENLQKLAANLASKGFEWDEISTVLRLYKKEL